MDAGEEQYADDRPAHHDGPTNLDSGTVDRPRDDRYYPRMDDPLSTQCRR